MQANLMGLIPIYTGRALIQQKDVEKGGKLLRGSSVFHKPMLPWAYPLDSKTLRVVVRVQRGLIESGKAVYSDRYAPLDAFFSVPLVKTAYDEAHDFFEAELRLDPPRFRYAFLLKNRTRSFWLHEQGPSADPPQVSFFQYPYINAGDFFEAPRWLTDGIVYQVFPDRFAKGNPALDPPGVRLWSEERPASDWLYGGDLQGIIQRLPYLRELGITVLYLTPVFSSPTNHKYDTTDYYRIDPAFGDEQTLKELVQKSHAAGIRVILDAVFNHCGVGFFAFQDVLSRGEDSLYADWFHVEGFPVRTAPVPNYETFSNKIASMPKLRTEHPEVRRYLLDVARHWIEAYGIDGWRIDVANEVDHAFWRAFRSVVKKANPQACIIGEIWHEALPWLQGDQFDGVTNYPLREACLEFFASGKCDAERFAEKIQGNLYIYGEPMLRSCWNLLGSHDTERLMTACGGDRNRAALAAVFNLTWLGTPLIYYGEEIGMEGQGDPDCRRPMLWDRRRWDQKLHGLYKRLIELRKREASLSRGRAAVLHADGAQNTLAYLRYCPLQGERSIVVLNNSAVDRIVELKLTWPGLLQGLAWEALVGTGSAERGGEQLSLGPYSALIGL